MKGWFFAKDSRLLRYGDGRKIEMGETHTVGGKPTLCRHGLHASKTLLDALNYAPGYVLYYVEVSGNMLIYKNSILPSLGSLSLWNNFWKHT